MFPCVVDILTAGVCDKEFRVAAYEPIQTPSAVIVGINAEEARCMTFSSPHSIQNRNYFLHVSHPCHSVISLVGHSLFSDGS